ncbi:MAG: ABC transporter ATP-binding protein [Thermomicrobiales bacterium]|nr:ABC transporter ATP-binding protein [Thermomicrobiales bacterium]
MTQTTGNAAESLIVQDLTKDFAGLRAVDGVSFTVNPGEILGLIGPNGSGKTTTINVVTGLLNITSGSVRLGSLDMTGWQPHRIARAGLARTFQIVRLFKDFTVRENVEVAAVASGNARGKVVADRADRALRQLGIFHLANTPARVLPQGEERLVEIARAIATEPRFLLLDEPGAGLNDAEIESFLPTLRRLRTDLGCGILIVDHDMRLIMNLCDRIHVLNYGKTIAEGTPGEVRREPAVIEVYLGAEEAA